MNNEIFYYSLSLLQEISIVGSFLRPKILKEARLKYKNHKLTKEECTDIENKCINDLIKKENVSKYYLEFDDERSGDLNL